MKLKTKIILFLSFGIFFLLFAHLLGFAHQENLIERLSPDTILAEDPKELFNLYKRYIQGQLNEIELKLRQYNGTCVGGPQTMNMTTKDKLEAFVKGPCLPVVLVPGLFGTKLDVKIDCPTLSEKHPEIFAQCGWKTCSRWRFWESKPKDHYLVWIADFLSEVNIIFKESATCWGELLKLHYNKSETDYRYKFKSPEGVNLTVFGMNEHTEEYADCGIGSVSNLLPVPYQVGMTRGYHELSEKLVSLGYQKGLTLYATPYDWRKAVIHNEVVIKLNHTIEQVYELTRKPVVIVGHSLGNHGILNYLNSMPFEAKKKYIHNFVAVVPPFAGSSLAVSYAIGGDPDFVWKDFGINFMAQKNLMGTQISIIDLQPKDIFERFQNEQWMKDWKARQELENKYSTRNPQSKAAWEEYFKSKSYTFDWFPNPLLDCSKNSMERPNPCGFNTYNWSDETLVEVQGKKYTGSTDDLLQIFRDHVLLMKDEHVERFFNYSMHSNVHFFDNPEVPITLIYGGHLKTEKSFNWNYDPKNNTINDEFAFPTSKVFVPGDGTVPVSHALVPVLKWAWEYDHKTNENEYKNAQPVKVVEMCVDYNNRGTIYDSLNLKKPHEIEYNEYIGLRCECNDKIIPVKNIIQKCHHAEAIGDDYIVDFVANIANNNYRISDIAETGAYILSNEALNKVANRCPAIYPGSRVYYDLLKETLEKVKEEVKSGEL